VLEGLVRIAPLEVQEIFCRRRHQPRRPPLAKIKPGRPSQAKIEEDGPTVFANDASSGSRASFRTGSAQYRKDAERP
jgi:hypothetical protein